MMIIHAKNFQTSKGYYFFCRSHQQSRSEIDGLPYSIHVLNFYRSCATACLQVFNFG